MAITQAMYRDMFVTGFEQSRSILRPTVTTEAMVKGISATFLVTGTNSSGMVERGVDGMIPARTRTDSQVTVTLKELHDRQTETSFNIFTGQSDRVRIMQESGMRTAEKQIDADILTALDSATNTWNSGSAVVPTKGILVDIISDLYENEVDENEPISAVWTPKAFARLQTIAEITSADYVNDKRYAGMTWRPFRWAGAMHYMSNRLPGKGTSTAKCFVYAKSAIGHAIDTAGIQTDIGYNGEHDYSYARHTLFHAAKILQNSGIVEVTYNDTTAFS